MADIEARRDHREAATEVQLVDVVRRPNIRLASRDDLVVIVRNAGRRTFGYQARVYHAENSYSGLRDGVWEPGQEIEFHPGPAKQVFSHIEIWLNGDCPCEQPEGARGHWRVMFPLPTMEDLDRKLLADEHRAAEITQAHLVTLEIDKMEWGTGTSRDRPGAELRSGAYLAAFSGMLHNYSPAPIFNVVVELAARAGGHSDLPYAFESVQVVGREQDKTIAVTMAGEVTGYLGATEEEARDNAYFVVRFTDAAGLRWERRDMGRPKQVFE